MIDRNLGTAERALRLLLALAAIVWLVLREHHDLWSAGAGLAALALTFNALYARCYLWALLGLNSCPHRPARRNRMHVDG